MTVMHTMTDSQFLRFSEYIRSACGIKLPPAKKTMLEGRLRKRLNALGLDSFDRYYDYILQKKGSNAEFVQMINAVSTNKTDFFREPDHFDFLIGYTLPELYNSGRFGPGRKLGVWSAGCSTGEEPYTLAMLLSEFAEGLPGFRFSILATDISTAVLDKARVAIYDHERVEPVPMTLRRKYLLRSKNKEKDLVRIVPELRNSVRFERLNFMDETYGINDPMAVIFCRNVLIYFDRPTQEKILYRLARQLMAGGYLFMGHSETLHGMDLPFVQVATTIHRKI